MTFSKRSRLSHMRPKCLSGSPGQGECHPFLNGRPRAGLVQRVVPIILDDRKEKRWPACKFR